MNTYDVVIAKLNSDGCGWSAPVQICRASQRIYIILYYIAIDWRLQMFFDAKLSWRARTETCQTVYNLSSLKFNISVAIGINRLLMAKVE